MPPAPPPPPDNNVPLSGKLRRLRSKLAERDESQLSFFSNETPAPVNSLEQHAPGEEYLLEDGTVLWMITEDVISMRPEFAELPDRLGNLLANRSGKLTKHLARKTAAQILPEDIVFLDLETTGLSNTPLFLIGALVFSAGKMQVIQYFARHYGEERAAIQAFILEQQLRPLLVTYNGASFDWPFLQNRARAQRIILDYEPAHLDMLYTARKLYRDKLPNCQLQTLESHLCGRERHDDIPGRLIPQAYHDFVKNGEAQDIARILEHNRLDLITLAELLIKLHEGT